MYEGNPVDLKMEKVISADGIFDETLHACRVLKYDLEEKDLTAISLDAKYRCYISTRTELLYCGGTVKERYQSADKNILRFRIEDGFYNVRDAEES